MDSKILSTGVRYSSLPESYVRPESERPRLSEVSQCEDVPVIDLGCEDRDQIIQQLGDACTAYGFFQVTNHGVSGEAIEKMLGVANEFFKLRPVEEKMKLYPDDPSKTVRLSTSFNVNNPPSFNDRDIVSNYRNEVRQLGYKLQELISEGLRLPGQTYGLPGHTDPNTLTILLQDLQAARLQVLKDGNWVSVNPHPDAFIIKVGDQLQESTCSGYMWHRTIPNTDEARLSVAYFLCTCDDAQIISPAKALTDDGSVTIYKSSTHGGIPADHGDILAANSGNPAAQPAEAQAGGSSFVNIFCVLFGRLFGISALLILLKEVIRSWIVDPALKEVVRSCIVDPAIRELSQKVVQRTSSRQVVINCCIMLIIMQFIRIYL